MRFYVEGVQVGSRSLSTPLSPTSNPLRIGGNSVWSGEFFDGVIDDVRVYNRALSASEVVTDRDTAVGGGSPPPPDTTAPTVSVTAPAGGATVSGSVNVDASASDDVGVANVQFKLDGADLGSADSVAPYSVSWNTAGASNGPHTLTAVARDAAGNSTTSSQVQVTVSNTQQAPTGLVAGYAFEEGSGASVLDASGRGNVGTISGAARTAAGRHGAALSFDGVNDWVTVPDSASLDLTSGMTLSAWVKTDLASKTWQTVALKEAPGTLSYALYATGDDSSPIAWWGSRGLGTPAAQAMQTGVWKHLAVVGDGAAMRFYVNGVQVASRSLPSALSPSANPLRIGGNSVWSGEFFDGVIDDVRVYNRALSASEVLTDRDTAVP
jgi:hypothetical protein